MTQDGKEATMRTRGTPALLAALALTVLGLAAASPGPQVELADPGAATAQVDQEAMTAEAYGPDVCAACHGEVVDDFHGPHAEIGSCVQCHGDATAHVEAGGGEGTIFSFDDDHAAPAKTAVCMECHGTQQPGFFHSDHAQVGMDCASCHSIHDPNPAHPANLKTTRAVDRRMDNLGVASQTCRECHGEVFTQFEFNERHRLHEGILDCQTCHDPHAAAHRIQLGGFQQQQCIQCHQDKDGPFVFEHGSSVVDGCVACHEPHGSPNRHMLKFQRTAELCYSCHAQVPAFHSRFTLDTVCTNCHSSIHGSNFDEAFLK
jgi:DmsE family decaheme c-type cytochrome